MKLCKDCAHCDLSEQPRYLRRFFIKPDPIFAGCTFGPTFTDPVTGETYKKEAIYCSYARNKYGACKPEAINFQPRTP